jgi:hypothetical protein
MSAPLTPAVARAHAVRLQNAFINKPADGSTVSSNKYIGPLPAPLRAPRSAATYDSSLEEAALVVKFREKLRVHESEEAAKLKSAECDVNKPKGTSPASAPHDLKKAEFVAQFQEKLRLQEAEEMAAKLSRKVFDIKDYSMDTTAMQRHVMNQKIVAEEEMMAKQFQGKLRRYEAAEEAAKLESTRNDFYMDEEMQEVWRNQIANARLEREVKDEEMKKETAEMRARFEEKWAALEAWSGIGATSAPAEVEPADAEDNGGQIMDNEEEKGEK